MGNKISRRRDAAPAEQKAAEEAIATQEAVVEAVAEEPVVVAESTEPVPVLEGEPETPKQPETEPPLEEPVSAPLVNLKPNPESEPAAAPPAEPEPETLMSVSQPDPVVQEPVLKPEAVSPVSEPVIEQEAVPEPNLSQEFLPQPVIPEPLLSPAPLLDLCVPEPRDAPPSHSPAPDQHSDLLGDAECYDDNVKATWNSVSVPEEPKESLEKTVSLAAEQLLCDVMGSELSKADS